MTQRLVLCWQAKWGNTSMQTYQKCDYHCQLQGLRVHQSQQ